MGVRPRTSGPGQFAGGPSDFAGIVTSMMFLRLSLIQERIGTGYSAPRDTVSSRQKTRLGANSPAPPLRL